MLPATYVLNAAQYIVCAAPMRYGRFAREFCMAIIPWWRFFSSCRPDEEALVIVIGLQPASWDDKKISSKFVDAQKQQVLFSLFFQPSTRPRPSRRGSFPSSLYCTCFYDERPVKSAAPSGVKSTDGAGEIANSFLFPGDKLVPSLSSNRWPSPPHFFLSRKRN